VDDLLLFRLLAAPELASEAVRPLLVALRRLPPERRGVLLGRLRPALRHPDESPRDRDAVVRRTDEDAGRGIPLVLREGVRDGMEQEKQVRRRRRRERAKTWSRLGNLGRVPTEYEIVTHGMNHTATPWYPLRIRLASRIMGISTTCPAMPSSRAVT
jgi:hypothetical protein